MIRNITILGAGSAGLFTAIALRRKLPDVSVRVIRSPEIGVIGVGEGTTPLFPQMLFDYLGLKRGQFFAQAAPTWKLGGRFLWGARGAFNYPFEITFTQRLRGLSKPTGFYCDDDYDFVHTAAAMMALDKAFPRAPDGKPAMVEYYAFHIENEKLVRYLENISRALGVIVTDGKVMEVERGSQGVAALKLESGETIGGDLFVDASGFRSELLGRTLGVATRDFSKSLFCDRAVIGGWTRTDEPIKPYTTQETMNAGWCWRIDHEHFINRGYVYSSRFISDEDAHAEFLANNPLVPPDQTRVVKFTSTRRELTWKDNVVAVGNASAFVEPLEATALNNLALQVKLLIQVLQHSDGEPTSSMVGIYNLRFRNWWDDTRDFLALHYKFNTRLDTPFWQTCREETDLGLLGEFVDFYRENGPTPMCLHALPHGRAIYGLEGHLAVLVGCKLPYRRQVKVASDEQKRWRELNSEYRCQAERGLNVKETLEILRKPSWSWDAYQPPRGPTALQL
jgi:tryptophan halogenase